MEDLESSTVACIVDPDVDRAHFSLSQGRQAGNAINAADIAVSKSRQGNLVAQGVPDLFLQLLQNLIQTAGVARGDENSVTLPAEGQSVIVRLVWM